MAVSVAYLALMNVNPITGDVYQRGGNALQADGTSDQGLNNLPIKGAYSFDTQFRVIVDPDNSSSTGNPTIEEYVVLEDAAARKVVLINQTMIITQD